MNHCVFLVVNWDFPVSYTHLDVYKRQTQAGKWEKNRFMGVEITAKTLGLIGAGNIGSIVAERAIGLKMRVIAYDPYLSPERAVALGVEKVELEDLLKRCLLYTSRCV